MTLTDKQILSEAMNAATREAGRFMGCTAPNPPVGAVALSESGRIIELAAHQRTGEEHAEALLLRKCREKGILQQVHTVCVTLEPCNHHGRTPACSEALINAGIKRVAIGISDPNPNVKGGGADRLRQAGIEVIEGIEKAACAALLHAFSFSCLHKMPFITVKRAFDAHGSMIPPKGTKTFTSDASLKLAHRLRKKADAIITGSGTILADSPLFTVRHIEDNRLFPRVLAILDRRQQVPDAYISASRERGFDVRIYQDYQECLLDLQNLGARDALVEAGPALSNYILASDLWSMKVDIFASQTPEQNDRVFVESNTKYDIPFSVTDNNLEAFLPQ